MSFSSGSLDRCGFRRGPTASLFTVLRPCPQAPHRSGLCSKRTAEVREDLQAANARIAELEFELNATDDQPLPTDRDRERPHGLLTERIHTGPVPVRKALSTALVERLEVHELEDIRPTV